MSLSKFNHFQEYELINFERKLLNRTNFAIISSNTATNFIDILLRLVTNINEDEINIFAAYAEDLLAKFWEYNESTLFSSITIAFSLLLKTFTRFNKDINIFLKSIPDYILNQFYNVEQCCIYIEKIAIQEEEQQQQDKNKIAILVSDRSLPSSPKPELPCNPISEIKTEKSNEAISEPPKQVKILSQPIQTQSPNSVTEIEKLGLGKRKISDLY
jgi:hypothetical protein